LLSDPSPREKGGKGNVLLQRAAHQRPLASKRGALERLFTLMFKGFVYNQIWEDPVVDLDALALQPHHRLITIASGGCNVLNYLVEGPARIIAIDLNPNHVALTLMKLQALEHLPDHDSFFRFFGIAKDKANSRAFDDFLAQRLDPETRRYWERRVPLRGRRINMFARNLYRYGLLGRFIGILHALARLHGKRLEDLLSAKTVEEQRVLFDRTIAPLFDNRLLKFLSRMPVSYYGLGIPPAQYDELVASASDGNPVTTLRERVERLACDFPISENYFAWQAFGRAYDVEGRMAVPAYLRLGNYETIKSRVNRVDVLHASMTEFLASQAARSLHRYVLLDAQDWMTPEQLTALWTEIDRTAHEDDARVIFRTAGHDSPLPKKLPPALLEPWLYLEKESRAFHARDRSSIYGGFHVYARRPRS
jgi:S-adenosylmethionine-diacylglycerol 3-amino-3-carboxypropyl transferase